jgi:hypothetical protein
MKTSFYSLSLIFGLLIALFSTHEVIAQSATHTDAASKAPVVGATVVVVGSNPLNGTTTDAEGNFRLVKVGVGRTALKITYLGYEDIFAKDIIVNAGKEVVLDFPMTESFTKLNEVTVKYKRTEDNKVTNNLFLEEMVLRNAPPLDPAIRTAISKLIVEGKIHDVDNKSR